MIKKNFFLTDLMKLGDHVVFEQFIQSKMPKGEAILRICEKYDISESTVKRMLKKYQTFKASEAESDSLLYQELQRDYAVQSAASKKPNK